MALIASTSLFSATNQR